MFTILGLVGVFAAVLGGFAMAGGPMHVLIQPSEFVIIVGAAIGTLIASAPGKMRSAAVRRIKKAFTGGLPVQDDYLELLEAPVRGLQLHAEERRASRSTST